MTKIKICKYGVYKVTKELVEREITDIGPFNPITYKPEYYKTHLVYNYKFDPILVWNKDKFYDNLDELTEQF